MLIGLNLFQIEGQLQGIVCLLVVIWYRGRLGSKQLFLGQVRNLNSMPRLIPRELRWLKIMVVFG